MKIKLFNRDHAYLWLEKIEEIEPNISKWKLKVDKNHLYCLEYMRLIGTFKDGSINSINAVDPSGGPFISLADEFEDGKYKIIKIIDGTTFLISERNNNN